jgi:hypothetical protein
MPEAPRVKPILADPGQISRIDPREELLRHPVVLAAPRATRDWLAAMLWDGEMATGQSDEREVRRRDASRAHRRQKVGNKGERPGAATPRRP